MSEHTGPDDDAEPLTPPEDEDASHASRDATPASPLIAAVNQSSSTARNSWIFFLAILTYLFVAVASVTHKDLLLDAPIKLPLLGVEVALSRFFKFAPLFVLLVHAGLLLQHAALADKAKALDATLPKDSDLTGPAGLPTSNARLELSRYYLTQSIAGTGLEVWRRLLLGVVVFGTLGVFPGILLSYFQATYELLPVSRTPSLGGTMKLEVCHGSAKFFERVQG